METESGNGAVLQRRRGAGAVASGVSAQMEHGETDESSIVSSCTSTVGDALHKTIAHWKILCLGQVLSLIQSSSGAFASEYKLSCSLSTPLLLLALMYLLLSAHFFSLVVQYMRGEKKADGNNTSNDKLSAGGGLDDQYRFPLTKMPLKGPWRLYFLCTVLNVESSFFLVRAYRYTSITSIALLTSLSIPGAMVASKMFLKSNYSASHVVGASICILGVVLNIFSDFEDDTKGQDVNYPDKALGDILAAIGGILVGVNDSVVEVCVKKYDQWEYLGLMGFFGVFLCVFQMYLFEIEDVIQLFDGTSECGPKVSSTLIILFIVSAYLKEIGDSYFLRVSEAALLNMCLLTVDFYSALFSIVAEGIIPTYATFFALLIIVGGVIIYENGPDPNALDNEQETADKLRTDYDFELTALQSIGHNMT